MKFGIVTAVNFVADRGAILGFLGCADCVLEN